jgi:hypothetical protein
MDLRGEVFGGLTVISDPMRLTCKTYDGRKYVKIFYTCRCLCDTITEVQRIGLLDGNIKSCECLQRDIATIHGLSSRNPTQKEEIIYHAWKAMKQRCYNVNGLAYHNYGGRGITVCESWMDSFETFWIDMQETWRRGKSLDRIDNDGHYNKANCRWATPKQCPPTWIAEAHRATTR